MKEGKLIFTQKLEHLRTQKEYLLSFGDDSETIKVGVSKKNLVSVMSKSKGRAYVILQTYNQVFAHFLSKYFSIPYGIGLKKTYTIDFPFNIGSLSKEITRIILNTVISCEGNIYYGQTKGDRVLKIKLASRKYIEKLQVMFEKLGIESRIFKASEKRMHVLQVRRKKNFEKLLDSMHLLCEYKQEILKKIVKSYDKDRMPHFGAKMNYLKLLEQYEPTTVRNISELSRKNYDGLLRVYADLHKRGYVSREGRKFLGTGTTPWIYKMTGKGLQYITCDNTKK